MIARKIQMMCLLSVVCFGQIGTINAQDRKLAKANEAYNKFAFIEAGKLFEELADKGNNTIEVYTKLGDCYYYNSNYAEAAKAFSKILQAKSAVNSEYYFRYAQCLNNLQQYEESAAVMKKYYNSIGKISDGEAWDAKAVMDGVQRQSGRYTLKNISVNTPASDFGTAFYGKDKVVFASGRDGGIIKRKHNWNDQAFLKLYAADISVDGNLLNPELVKGDVNTKYHQSTPAITNDGRFMYFTRSNFIDGKIQSDKQGTTYLKIYRAENIKGEWKNIKELPYPINSDGFSSAHPALSPDESQLFFSSDRNNNFGNSDIYVVSVNKDGKISNDVTKLGDEINTLGRETYPYVDSQGILYFASDGHPGLGGLDVFAAMKDEQGKYHVVNLGPEINSTSDDFAYIINSEKVGFFSSNRNGNDDIYGFVENKPVIFDFNNNPIVFGTILEDGMAVKDLVIEVYNKDKEIVSSVVTDEQGKYSFSLQPYVPYRILYKKEGLTNKTIDVVQLKPMEKKELEVNLVKEMEVVINGKTVTLAPGDDLTNKLELKPIYFDLNGSNIRTSSKKELQIVIDLMKDRPAISIKVNSYTDSRGRDEYNMKLSQARAKATVDYIIKNGINASRISGEGFGETKLLNGCSNGVPCSEKEHEINRRSEFIINF